MKKIVLITVVALLAAISCSTTKDTKSFDISNAMGKEFILDNIYKDLAITIGFEKDRVFGYAGVNRYFGPYTLEGDKITMTNLATTMMAGHPKDMEAEKVYLGMLTDVKNINIKDDTLTLKLSNGKELIYTKK